MSQQKPRSCWISLSSSSFCCYCSRLHYTHAPSFFFSVSFFILILVLAAVCTKSPLRFLLAVRTKSPTSLYWAVYSASKLRLCYCASSLLCFFSIVLLRYCAASLLCCFAIVLLRYCAASLLWVFSFTFTFTFTFAFSSSFSFSLFC